MEQFGQKSTEYGCCSIPIKVGKQGKVIKQNNDGKSLCLLSRDYKGFGNQEMNGVEEIIMKVPEATKKGCCEIEVGGCVDLSQPNSKTRRGRKMEDKSNCLTTEMSFYQYVEPCGCAMRGRYFESNNRFKKHEGGTYQALEVRNDNKSNAVTTVTKDSMICEQVNKPIRLGNIGKSKGQANRVYSVRGKSVCLQSQSGGGGAKTGLYKIDLPDGEYIVRKLYPIEAERLQTLPDNYTEGVSDTQRYKCIGNGWTVDVIAHILKNLK